METVQAPAHHKQKEGLSKIGQKWLPRHVGIEINM